jgi:hypothetical protein
VRGWELGVMVTGFRVLARFERAGNLPHEQWQRPAQFRIHSCFIIFPFLSDLGFGMRGMGGAGPEMWGFDESYWFTLCSPLLSEEDTHQLIDM